MLNHAPRAGGKAALKLAGMLLALLALTWLAAACTTPPAATPGAVATAPAAAAVAASPAVAVPATAVIAVPPAGTAAAPAAAPKVDMSKVETGVNSDGHFYRGDPKASIKMVEYSDFQCPYCARFAADAGAQLDASYIANGQVVHVFRNFPLLDIHPKALPAAKVAYCAGQQNPAFFWEMHDWLFGTQDTWAQAANSDDLIRKQALSVGVDATKLDACIKAPETEAAIKKDQDDGLKAGVEGTPAFFVNDWFLNGAQPFDAFKQTIDKAQKGEHPAPTPTPLPAGVLPYDPDPKKPGFTYDGSPTLGDAKAPLVWISFDDFKCQPCAQFVKDIEPALNDKYVKTGKMRMVAKFYPTDAPQATIASLCAADQGKFWEYRDALLGHQADWKDDDKASLTKYAKDLKLDEAKFDKCLTDKPGQARIDEDMSIGQQVQLERLPSFLIINPGQQTGTKVSGPKPLADLDTLIDQFLNPKATPTPAGQAIPTPKQ